MPLILVLALMAALLNAAPPDPEGSQTHTMAADPRPDPAYLLKFTLEESPSEIVALMGPPTQTADFDVNYRVWQYQIAVEDNHDFSHTFCFRKSDGKLVSVTRSFGEERNVAALFPRDSRRIHHWPKAEKPQYSVMARELPGERILLAMGVSKPDQPTGQLLLIRRDAVRFFLPWLVPQLQAISIQRHRPD
jgi:hypothetical protein